MRTGFLGAIAALLACAGLVWGQEPPTSSMPPDAGFAPGMDGVIPYPPPMNPEGLATNDVRKSNFWFGVDYLGMYAKRARFAYPLVTTSASSQFGIVGQSTTSVLYAGPDAQELFSGARINGGLFFASDNRFGAEFGGFILAQDKQHFAASSEGSGVPLLAVPFIDTSTGQNSAAVVAAASLGPGDVTVDFKSQIWGADAHWLLNLYRSSPQSPWGFNLNVFAGVSVFSLRERLDIVTHSDFFDNVQVPFNGQVFHAGTSFSSSIRQVSGSGPNAIFQQTSISTDTILSNGTVDRFRTSNQLYGGEVGFSEQLRVGRWSLGFTGKLGLGLMHSSVEVQGYSTLFQLGNQAITTQRVNSQGQVIPNTTVITRSQALVQQTVAGGIYAVNGQSGRRSHNTFGYMPEGIVTLNYQFTPTVVGSLGYSYLYVNRVVRVANVVNPRVDSTQQPFSSTYGTGQPPTPTNLFPYSSYWVQGINVGLSIQY